MASIKDVAKLANVSPATVSRVLNNTANVKEEKRQRVLWAVKETGFKTVEETRQISKKSTKTICLVVPDVKKMFFEELEKAIERAAFQKGYRLLLVNFDENVEKELSTIQTLSRVKADGIIITSGNKKIDRILSKTQLPIVAFEQLNVTSNIIGSVEANHYEGGKLAMQHLIECGCKNIVYLRNKVENDALLKKYAGYKEICEKYGIKEACLYCDQSVENASLLVKEILLKYPRVDGILASDDMSAISLYKAFGKEGYQIPKDIQIIGYDNIRLSGLHSPGISTIGQPFEDMGTLAVQMILDYFNEQPFQKENILDVSLIERQTTRRKEIRYEKTGDFK